MEPPKAWTVRAPYLELRVAERWGRDPFEWLGTLTPARRAVLMVYEKWRGLEERAMGGGRV